MLSSSLLSARETMNFSYLSHFLKRLMGDGCQVMAAPAVIRTTVCTFLERAGGA